MQLNMNKNTIRNNQLRIVTDIALWNLLLQGVKKQPKYSRLEAFCDLMERQRIANVNGTAAITNSRIIFKSIILMLLY